MSIFAEGTQVTIRNLTTKERFRAWLTDVDPSSGYYFATKINKTRGNTHAPALQVLAKAIRMDDGTPAKDAEEYVIESTDVTSAEFSAILGKAEAELQVLRADNAALQKMLLEVDAKSVSRLKAIGDTLASFCRDEEMAVAIRKTIETGLPHKAKPVIEAKPNQKAVQPA